MRAYERRERSNPLKRAARWAQAGTQNALEVMRLSRIAPMTNAPYEIIEQDRMHRLRRYARTSPGPSVGGPLLLVPPLMLTAEIYDVSPELSAVTLLAAAGVDAFVIDFGAPEREEGGMERTLDDHVRTVAKAIATVKRLTGKNVHLGGYSQGGMFCYQAAAYVRSENLASIITFGSPVDVHRNLPLVHADVFASMAELGKKLIDGPLQHIEGLPGVLTSTAFKLLTPRKELEQIIDLVRQLHDRQELEKRAMRRRFLGGEGFVAWPGPALRAVIDQFVVHNRLMAGGIVVDGQTITLADITCPVLMFVGMRDDIARPAAVRGIVRAAPMADVSEIDLEAGHFGLVVGSRAKKETWPSVIEWIKWRDDGGPTPALLRPKKREIDTEWDDADDWDIDVDLDYELMADAVTGAVSSAWRKVSDAITDATDSLDAVRHQLPRLRRLEQIAPDTEVSLGKELATRAKQAPEETFFLWQGRAFSFAQAEARVSNVVSGLFACGVEPRKRVGVVMNGRPSLLTMVTALNRMIAVAVVLPYDASDEALREAMASSRVEHVTTDPENAARVRGLTDKPVLVLGGGGTGAGPRTLPDGVIDMEAIDPKQVKLPSWFEPDAGLARDLALVLFTPNASGALRPSTITNHRWAFSALGAAAACTLSERDTVFACLPLHHPAGMLVSVGGALVSGARLALGGNFDPTTFLTEVRRTGSTVVFYAGEMMRGLVLAPATPFDRNHALRLVAGSGMRADLARELTRRFGVGVLEFYASTTHNVVFANASGEKPGAVGRPLPGSAEVAIVRIDFDTGLLLRDASGRCVLTDANEPGAAIARLPDRAIDPDGPVERARIVRDAFTSGDRWYLLRDILSRDADGDHAFIEARSNVILTPGGMVFPRKVEDAFYRIPDVEVVVVQPMGPATNPTLVASVVARAPLATATLEAALDELPPHARPKYVRQVEHIAMTAGYRPLATPLSDADVAPRPHVRVLRNAASGTGFEEL